jgi:hypothetical protein
VGDGYPQGPLEGKKGLAKGFGPIVSQGRPLVGHGRTAGRKGRCGERVGSGLSGSLDLRAIHSADPTFPRGTHGRRNQIRISWQDCGKISSISSLLLRDTSSSYAHVMPHGRVYKA